MFRRAPPAWQRPRSSAGSEHLSALASLPVQAGCGVADQPPPVAGPVDMPRAYSAVSHDASYEAKPHGGKRRLDRIGGVTLLREAACRQAA